MSGKPQETGPAGKGVTGNDVAILVPSFDGYEDLWKPFFACFFKYWPDCPYPVFLGSNFNTYDDPRVTPIRIGPDRDYSSNLIAMLSGIRHEWVIVMIEDILLSAPVRTEALQSVIVVAQKMNTGLLQLLPRRFDPNVEFAATRVSNEISEIEAGLPYRVSVNLGLWKRRVLLALLRPGETAWQFERYGSLRTFELASPFLCMSRKYLSAPLFRYVHGVIKGRWTIPAARFLMRENLSHNLSTRPVQRLPSRLRFVGYSYLRCLTFWIVYRVRGKRGVLELVVGRQLASK